MSEASHIFIDGIRKLHFLEAIKEKFPTYVLYIDSDLQTRYKRLYNRGEKANERDMSFETFQKEEIIESQHNLKEIQNIADVFISNTDSEKEFIESIENTTAPFFNKFYT